VPVAVAGIRSAVAVSAGYQDDETCALLAGGRVACWGANGSGQLGAGRRGDCPRPVVVGGIAHAVSIAAGGQHACAVIAGGAVYCWGHNNLGQLGTASTRDSTVPRRVRGLPGPARAVAVSPRSYSCAAMVSGAVFCWGINSKAQLGSGRAGGARPVPVRVAGVRRAVAITTGIAHACVLLARGAGAECWGYDDYGQLGDGPGNRLLHKPAKVVF
jgi:alpha-tubulin suppressor-like RCC1 family protein